MSSRQKLMAVVAGVLVVALAWVGALFIGAYVDDRSRTDRLLRQLSEDVLAQSKINQRHIDCLASFLIRRNPDGCQSVREQLVRDGILPEDQAGNPTTG